VKQSYLYKDYEMNRRKTSPFTAGIRAVSSHKATWREIPTDTVDAYYNSQTCSCRGERGYRQGRRFRCTNDKCNVAQDHADRNASVNSAWRETAKLDGNESNYRTHKTQPQVRLVRLSGSGRVSRPTSSCSLAEQGVLAHG
jgi:putative transposase